MLRDFVYTIDSELIGRVLSEFDVPVQDDTRQYALVEFRVITPDSFMWRLLIDGVVYYLYAEDYIQDIDDARKNTMLYAPSGAALSYVKTKRARENDDAYEMQRFSVESGYDHVFLCKSNEDAVPLPI